MRRSSLIRTYEQAIENKDIGLYPIGAAEPTRAEETVLTNSFRQIDKQEIDIRVETSGSTAGLPQARLVRRDIADTAGGARSRTAQQTRRFQKTEAGWFIASDLAARFGTSFPN